MCSTQDTNFQYQTRTFTLHLPHKLYPYTCLFFQFQHHKRTIYIVPDFIYLTLTHIASYSTHTYFHDRVTAWHVSIKRWNSIVVQHSDTISIGAARAQKQEGEITSWPMYFQLIMMIYVFYSNFLLPSKTYHVPFIPFIPSIPFIPFIPFIPSIPFTPFIPFIPLSHYDFRFHVFSPKYYGLVSPSHLQEWLWSVIACRSALSPVSRRDLMMFGLGGVVALGSMLWMDATRPKRQWST